jgi:hypothetical protein
MRWTTAILKRRRVGLPKEKDAGALDATGRENSLLTICHPSDDENAVIRIFLVDPPSQFLFDEAVGDGHWTPAFLLVRIDQTVLR